VRTVKYFVFMFAAGMLIYFLTNLPPIARTVSVRATDGYADISGLEFTDNIVEVSGWESYPNHLYTPSNFASGHTDGGVVFTDTHAATVAYGTHRVRLSIGKPFSISFQSLDYATRVFIDGNEVNGMGVVGATAAESTP